MAEQDDAPARETGVLAGMLVQIHLAAPDLAHSANGRLRGFQLHNSGSIPLCAISRTEIYALVAQFWIERHPAKVEVCLFEPGREHWQRAYLKRKGEFERAVYYGDCS